MKSDPVVYLDYNATTPVDPVVLETMLPFFSLQFANPASTVHAPGREIARLIEEARNTIADFVACETNEIIFTSGSTESINLAIKGVAQTYKSKGKHIITWATEHKAVLDVCASLVDKGFEISILPVNREGEPDVESFRECLRDDTILTCMMLANNETGVIHPVRAIADVAHEKGCIFFCDATQAPGKLRFDVNDLGADLLCISAHKMYGPKGCGALFVRRKNPRVRLEPLMDGGGHEKGLRSGTLNVPAIIGFAAATKLCSEKYWDDAARMLQLRTLLEQQLTTNGMGYVNGSVRNRLPNTTNICFPGIRASSLMTHVPQIAVASGSACSSALPQPSHVLLAMGLTTDEAYSSIRFSLGRGTTMEEVNAAVLSISNAIATGLSGNQHHLTH